MNEQANNSHYLKLKQDLKELDHKIAATPDWLENAAKSEGYDIDRQALLEEIREEELKLERINNEYARK